MNNQVKVVSVTYNNERTIERMLKQLLLQQAHIASIVIVDNGSNDETVNVVDRIIPMFSVPIAICRGGNIGFAAGIMQAASQSIDQKLPYLALNPDVVLSDGSIAGLLSVLNSDVTIGIVTGPLLMLDGTSDSASIRKLPSLASGGLHGVLGKLTPIRFRYNGVTLVPGLGASELMPNRMWTNIEATTGALMLLSSDFRPGPKLFDTDYWMYGEDLQLCADARTAGYCVAMAHIESSLHLKGTSSGWPRSRKSNIEFHRAMYIYYRKNLDLGLFMRLLVGMVVASRLTISLMVGTLSKLYKIRSCGK